MALKDWRREPKKGNYIIFSNKKNPSLTVEIHKFDDRDIAELNAKYYIFPAINGRGLVSSPEMSMTKNEALAIAIDIMKKSTEEIMMEE